MVLFVTIYSILLLVVNNIDLVSKEKKWNPKWSFFFCDMGEQVRQIFLNS